jgi:hypothetical protein
LGELTLVGEILRLAYDRTLELDDAMRRIRVAFADPTAPDRATADGAHPTAGARAVAAACDRSGLTRQSTSDISTGQRVGQVKVEGSCDLIRVPPGE